MLKMARSASPPRHLNRYRPLCRKKSIRNRLNLFGPVVTIEEILSWHRWRQRIPDFLNGLETSSWLLLFSVQTCASVSPVVRLDPETWRFIFEPQLKYVSGVWTSCWRFAILGFSISHDLMCSGLNKWATVKFIRNDPPMLIVIIALRTITQSG